MRPPQNFSVRQIADLIGCGHLKVRKEIKAGRLSSFKGLNGQIRVNRSELVAWLLRSKFPLDQLRDVLNPGGAVMLVRTDHALFEAMNVGERVYLTSLFDLGRRLTERTAWAVVVDLPTCGTEEACRSLEAVSNEPDRPTFVGLYGDDGVATDLATRVFDVLLSKAGSPVALARSILRLRPNARTRDL